MPNPKCAACGKTAYPLESVKALDKTYHKFCFKCEECKITLNIKTFKGKNGKIYCNAHYPVERASTTGDSVQVKQATTAPKKKAEGLSQVHKGSADNAYNPNAEVIRHDDRAAPAADQSVSYEPQEYERPQDNYQPPQQSYAPPPAAAPPAAAPAEEYYQEGEEEYYEEGEEEYYEEGEEYYEEGEEYYEEGEEEYYEEGY